MLFIEKQLEELRRIDDPVTRESDFDDFWNGNIAKVAAHDSHPEMKYLKDYPVENIRIYDVRVHGLDETPVHAWVLIPAKASPKNKVPAAVAFHGGNTLSAGFTLPPPVLPSLSRSSGFRVARRVPILR